MQSIVLRMPEPETRFEDAVVLNTFEQIVPTEKVNEVLDNTNTRERRKRKLPARICVLLVIAMSLFTEENIEKVLTKMVQGLRLAWLHRNYQQATDGAICQARYRLGPKPLVELFHRNCSRSGLVGAIPRTGRHNRSQRWHLIEL